MCEYCENKNQNEIKGKEFNLLPTFGFKNDRKYNSWILKSPIDKKVGIMITTDNSNAVYFNINFCPICGRNLKNDKDVKSANNYSLNKLKAEVDRLNKITDKLKEENELRKEYYAEETHKLLTRMRLYEEDKKWR